MTFIFILKIDFKGVSLEKGKYPTLRVSEPKQDGYLNYTGKSKLAFSDRKSCTKRI